MTAARFRVDDRVFVTRMEGGQDTAGLFFITRVLPFERSTGYQYRVQRLPAGEQRIVQEAYLTAAPTL